MEYGSEFEVPSQRSNRQAEFLRAPCDQMKIITLLIVIWKEERCSAAVPQRSGSGVCRAE